MIRETSAQRPTQRRGLSSIEPSFRLGLQNRDVPKQSRRWGGGERNRAGVGLYAQPTARGCLRNSELKGL